MIRPVTDRQMQHAQQPQLQSPRKPRTNVMLQSPSTPPKSPIKKHFQNAFALEISSVNATAASSVHASEDSTPRHGPLNAKLRASVLQSVLHLLDQDANALTVAEKVLQAAAALPLAEPSVQRACLQALRELGGPNSVELTTSPMPPSFVYDSSSPSNTKWNVENATFPMSSPRKMFKAAQGTKSLHHCKEFLLACANEIHELEDDHSARFDYAEDTASSSNLSMFQSSKMQAQPKCKHCGVEFDYASTVPDCTSIESDDDSSDSSDTCADQGSQFSEVLHRAEYMSDVDDASDDGLETPRLMLVRDRTLCRQVLRALHEFVQAQSQRQLRRSSAPNLAMKYHVFQALKLQASLTRKRNAFHRLKSGLRSSRQQLSANMIVKPKKLAKAYDMAFQKLVLRHSDILLLILALAFLANLPAQYIV